MASRQSSSGLAATAAPAAVHKNMRATKCGSGACHLSLSWATSCHAVREACTVNKALHGVASPARRHRRSQDPKSAGSVGRRCVPRLALKAGIWARFGAKSAKCPEEADVGRQASQGRCRTRCPSDPLRLWSKRTRFARIFVAGGPCRAMPRSSPCSTPGTGPAMHASYGQTACCTIIGIPPPCVTQTTPQDRQELAV